MDKLCLSHGKNWDCNPLTVWDEPPSTDTRIRGVYKPTSITGRPHIVGTSTKTSILLRLNPRWQDPNLSQLSLVNITVYSLHVYIPLWKSEQSWSSPIHKMSIKIGDSPFGSEWKSWTPSFLTFLKQGFGGTLFETSYSYYLVPHVWLSWYVTKIWMV